MISAFLPCRRGSQRIPNKNIKTFAGVEGGLLEIKLNQLCKVNEIDSIVISSNDNRVLEFANTYKDSRIVIDDRPEHLGANETTTDQLIQYVPELIKEGHVLWTHVTSPFMNEVDYSKIIKKYEQVCNAGFDSLLTVLKLRGFIWDENGPISYDRSKLKWPMTQNIKPFFEVDSGVFLSSITNYLNCKDRIGSAPYLYQQEKIKSVDIDWPEDFELAAKIWLANK